MNANVREYLNELRKEAQKKFIPVMRQKTAELLESITDNLKPERCLEIGTCIGVSGITVLASGGGKLTTVEIDRDRLFDAEKNFINCGVRDRVNFIEGDCFTILDYLAGNRYDLIVLDGPKGHYDVLYEIIKPMLNKGGVIFADDIGYHGLTDGEKYPEHKHRTIVRGMREFIRLIGEDNKMRSNIYDIEDGVAVIEKIMY